jgi:hypothetical protein
MTSLSWAEDPAPAPPASEAARSSAASTSAEAAATPSAPVAETKAASDASAAATAASTAEAAAAKTEKAAVDPIALKKAGYKLVNENGQELYCREDLKTGSHLKKTRTCLTERELAALQDNTRREIEYMRTRQPPPQGK